MEDDIGTSLQARCRYFGDRLAQRRIKMGFTLEELAKRTQISVSYLNNLEKAFLRRPSPTVPGDERLQRLARELGVSFTEINSWLGRGPENFDDVFWKSMEDVGYRPSLTVECKQQILVCIGSVIRDDARRSRQRESEQEERIAEIRRNEALIELGEFKNEGDSP